MKESTAFRLSTLVLVLCVFVISWMLSGCALDHTIEVYEYKVRHYVYHDFYDLQDAIDSFERVKGFHQVVDGVHEIHNMSGDFCNTGHEIEHAEVYEGKKPLSKHFR